MIFRSESDQHSMELLVSISTDESTFDQTTANLGQKTSNLGQEQRRFSRCIWLFPFILAKLCCHI